MAKQTKSQTPPSAPKGQDKTPAKTGVKIGEPNGGDRFIRCYDAAGVPTVVEEKTAKGTMKKMAPQVIVIANLLETAGKEGLTRKELVEKLPAAGLVTKQPPGRIVSYYQKPMVDAGVITIVKAAAAA